IVALASEDDYGRKLLEKLAWRDKPILHVNGGIERGHSVLNALRRLAEFAAPHDWVFVHDAVRPCLCHEDIDKLIHAVEHHPDGALLGLRVSDTVKRATGSGEVLETLNRDELWRAQTPQLFQLAALTAAMSRAIEQKLLVTDEASAMALNGAIPLMVEGHASNIKITHLTDLALAQYYLEQQETGA
ncbi:MAG: 2-C-methyl-D-erythritol 4-phosphate cytidylyltransferase, partial [Gammaproteobacteria bacterium]